jgi:site-specific DNA-cytosine methylase
LILGFESAGFETVAAVEENPVARATLLANAEDALPS